MKTTVIFVRHGQSEWNLKGILQGQKDPDLSALGCRQADLAAEWLKDKKIDLFYSSDLQRAYHTAEAIARPHGNPTIHAVRDLREIFCGAWEGMTFDRIKEQFTEDYERWNKDYRDSSPTGGENIYQLSDRIFSFFDKTVTENRGKTILVVTHGIPVRLMQARALGILPQNSKQIPIAPNASATFFEVDDGGNITMTLSSETCYLSHDISFFSENF